MTTVGRYQILEKIGQGGMGVVYRAFDTLIERVVALKIISGPIQGNPDSRERFVREARAAGQLSHPNIITIHDLGEHEGQPYLAMEFLQGEDLQTRMARPEKMSLRHKVELAIEICFALEYAHARGVVHRDIKPANIFITDTGGVKILDFGLARLLTSELTGSHMLMGTLNYMAPEQVRGQRADHRADIFSVGVVLYELLCGRKAFAGDSFASTLYKILNEVPEPLLAIDPTLPPELTNVVERALAKPRDERYQNMGEMLRDLAMYRQQLAALDTPAGGRLGSGGQRPLSDPAARPPSDRPRSGPSLPASPSSDVPVGRRGQLLPVAIAAAAIVAATGLWFAFGRSERAAPAAPTTGRASSTEATADVSLALQRALDALQRADYPAVERFTGEVLAQVPDHPEARRVRDRAREAADAVSRGLREAQAHFAAGRFEQASRAAGDVLSVVPDHPEAKRIMEEGASRSRGQGADEARTRMMRARTSARAANAPALAAGFYRAAGEAERDAQRLYQDGRLPQATAKFYEASGLYRSSQIAAEGAAAAEAERARASEAERARRASPPAATPAPSLPAPPVSSGAPVSALPPAVVPSPPPAPPSPAPPEAPGPTPGPASEPPRAVPPEQAINTLLERYEAALEARSFDALKRLWPDLSGAQQDAIQSEFRHASRIRVEVVDPRITTSDGSATATFLRRYELMTVDGQRLSTESRTTMTLRRLDGGWIIESIRFDAPRRGA